VPIEFTDGKHAMHPRFSDEWWGAERPANLVSSRKGMACCQQAGREDEVQRLKVTSVLWSLLPVEGQGVKG
jgi:hypothetical protein